MEQVVFACWLRVRNSSDDHALGCAAISEMFFEKNALVMVPVVCVCRENNVVVHVTKSEV